MSGNVIKGSFFEKLGKFLREMIVLLYRFSKVAGLTCKLDNSVINCGSFPVIFFWISGRTIFGKPVNKCFWANRRGRLEVFWKTAIQNLLRKFSIKPIFSLVASFQPLLKNRLPHEYIPVNFLEIFKTAIL